jgi:hypothetical protein
MREASHLTRLLLHLSQAWGLRELRVMPSGVILLIREVLGLDISVVPIKVAVSRACKQAQVCINTIGDGGFEGKVSETGS